MTNEDFLEVPWNKCGCCHVIRVSDIQEVEPGNDDYDAGKAWQTTIITFKQPDRPLMKIYEDYKAFIGRLKIDRFARYPAE